MRWMRGPIAVLSLALMTAFTATSASAQGIGADGLFDQGRKLMGDGNYALAAQKLEESHRLEPAPGTLLNLAECYVKLGRTASAWSTYRTAAALAASQK